MEEPETKKKRKKKTQAVILKEQEEESPALAELVDVLDELEKKRKFIDVQICPKCKSPKVRRVKTMSGDLWSHMGLLPAKYECPDCGGRARLGLEGTNNGLRVKDGGILAEAVEAENQRQ